MLVAVLADEVGEVVQGAAGQRDRERIKTAQQGSRSGHRILVDCCPTRSLTLIDLRARRTRPELPVQLGKGSMIPGRSTSTKSCQPTAELFGQAFLALTRLPEPPPEPTPTQRLLAIPHVRRTH